MYNCNLLGQIQQIESKFGNYQIFRTFRTLVKATDLTMVTRLAHHCLQVLADLLLYLTFQQSSSMAYHVFLWLLFTLLWTWRARRTNPILIWSISLCWACRFVAFLFNNNFYDELLWHMVDFYSKGASPRDDFRDDRRKIFATRHSQLNTFVRGAVVRRLSKSRIGFNFMVHLHCIQIVASFFDDRKKKRLENRLVEMRL